MQSAVDAIIQDIYQNQRAFPGSHPTRREVRSHLKLPILVDGLDTEESALMLSTIPRHGNALYLTPMDKGLSGSKVYSARYSFESGAVSKPFVFKLGQLNKVQKEFEVMQQLVVPHIPGVSFSCFRRGIAKSLLVQDLAGLSSSSNLTSLRLFARGSSRADETLNRLFLERFSSWYFDNASEKRQVVVLGELFARYLRKGGDSISFPTEWSELARWVKDLSGYGWDTVGSTLNTIKHCTIEAQETMVHGDLHSQNILVDGHGDCWPIDFAWSTHGSSPIVDLVMLEASLKFLAIPMRADLRILLELELALSVENGPTLDPGPVPYCEEIGNVLSWVTSIRRIAVTQFGYQYTDYLKSLALLTFSLSNHPHLNRPFVLGSVQILAGRLKEDL